MKVIQLLEYPIPQSSCLLPEKQIKQKRGTTFDKLKMKVIQILNLWLVEN